MDNMNWQEELKKAEKQGGKSWAEMNDREFNPLYNPDAITIIKQIDGNFKLWGQRFGKMVEIRSVKPEDCLSEFLTGG